MAAAVAIRRARDRHNYGNENELNPIEQSLAQFVETVTYVDPYAGSTVHPGDYGEVGLDGHIEPAFLPARHAVLEWPDSEKPGVAPESDEGRVQSDSDKFQAAKDVAEKEQLLQFREAAGFHRNENIVFWIGEEPDKNDKLLHSQWRVSVFMELISVKLFLAAVIVVNAILIGVQADYADQNDPTWVVIEALFVAVYTVELGLNLYGFGRLYLKDGWNWLDIIIVFSSLVDLIVSVAMDDGSGDSGIGILRMVRVLRVLMRLSRIMKVVTIRGLEKLYILTQSYLVGLANAGYVLGLMTLLLYIFAVLGKELFYSGGSLQDKLMETTVVPGTNATSIAVNASNGSTYYITTIATNASITKTKTLDLDILFGTIPRTFVTLWQFATSDDAMELQRPLGEAWPFGWIYMVLVFAAIGVGCFELIFSIFVDSLIAEEKERKIAKRRHGLKVATHVSKQVRALISMLDINHDGMLSEDEKVKAHVLLNEPEWVDMMQKMEINPESFPKALELQDLRLDGTFFECNFIRALLSAKEKCKSGELREIIKRLHEIRRRTEKQIDQQHNAIRQRNEKVMEMIEKQNALISKVASQREVLQKRLDSGARPLGSQDI